MKKAKLIIFNVIRDDDENDLISKLFDGFIISLIVVNVILVIADTFDLPSNLKRISGAIEVASVVVFTIEYLLRFWVADLRFPQYSPLKTRLKYVFSFMSIIDLLAILPFYIPFLVSIDLRVLRVLRISRLFRLFKVNRYTHALSTIGSVFVNKAHELLSSMFMVMLLMIIAAVLMYNVESVAQPDKFDNAFSSLWWAVATLTTVGYGDVYPVTVLGKILSGVIAILGVGLVAVPTGIISAGFMEQVESSKEENHDEKCFCPYCGKRISK